MKKAWIAYALIALFAVPVTAATRTLSDTYPADGLERVSLEVGVGEVQVIATDGDEVELEVVLKPRRGGIFTSMRRAEEEVEEAELEVEAGGRELELRVNSDTQKRRFEEHWTLHMPARLEIELEIGVGEVEIRGLAGGVEIEAGVGDVFVDVSSGDISIELGVGDVDVKAPLAAYGAADCEGGVGDARLSVSGRSVKSEGFIGHSASWRGDGERFIEVEVGVGGARVNLD